MWEKKQTIRILIGFLVILCILFGIYLRFYRITENQFFYYDEGYYLQFNRKLLELVEPQIPLSASDLWMAIKNSLVVASGSTKALWIFLMDLRVYFLGIDAWYFPRLLSAVFGSLTLLVCYLFAKRYYQSHRVALFSVVLLALLPSHVFYSRMALQEALSTLFLLGGFYFYLFPRKFGWRTLLSGICFGGAFYTNYRLIIIPILLAACEFYQTFIAQEKFRFRNYLWSMLVFSVLVFIVGNIGRADNTYSTFSWMFYQAQLAKERYAWINYLSYPFYLFKLESFLWGAFFFGNIALIFSEKRKQLLPFILPCIQMMIFSVAMEKGVRYICVVMPFMAMTVSFLIFQLYDKLRDNRARIAVIVLCMLMLFVHAKKSTALSRLTSDYEKSMVDIHKIDPKAKVLSTQEFVHGLFAKMGDVEQCAPDFRTAAYKNKNGFKYLIIDPQAYIAFTRDKKRFSPKLLGFLEFINREMMPVKVYDHFSPLMLERFVFEHSEHLGRSIEFLRNNKKYHYGQMRVYDLDRTISIMNRAILLKR